MPIGSQGLLHHCGYYGYFSFEIHVSLFGTEVLFCCINDIKHDLFAIAFASLSGDNFTY